jgi:hypothetical protein
LTEKSRLESNKQNVKENDDLIQNLKNEYEQKKKQLSIQIDLISDERKAKQKELTDT